MSYFLKFTIETVFEDPRLNVWFNQLYTVLSGALGDTVYDDLFLDGMVALYLQNEESRVRDKRIILSTLKPDVFRFVLANVRALNIKSFIREGNSILFVLPSDHLVYFILSDIPLIEPLDFKGILLRNENQIK